MWLWCASQQEGALSALAVADCLLGDLSSLTWGDWGPIWVLAIKVCSNNNSYAYLFTLAHSRRLHGMGLIASRDGSLWQGLSNCPDIHALLKRALAAVGLIQVLLTLEKSKRIGTNAAKATATTA
jgi:hypothetical protein